MEPVWQIIIGFFIAFILHELTHLIVILYYKIPIRDRRAFNHHNNDKWVNKERYNKYIKWKEEHK